ncbi:MAG: sugar ABC transporter substrate-binding protein [Clostridiales bacterium]|nr:sugar ABC transporter substrate-binding protein [Clostridiales bacterium]
MKNRWIARTAAALMVSFALAGCSAGEQTGSENAAVAAESAESEAQAADNSTGSTEGIQADDEWYAKADLSVLEGKKIGITIQSLRNAYWAGVMSGLEEQLELHGAEYTIVACDDNSATQIGQIENFVSAGCDLIMVHPSDANAVEDACAEARNAGIKVMCWDDPMTNTDGNWILNNTDLGIEIGKLAGEFINEHYSEDNKAQVAVIGYPQTKILKERGDGIKQGLEETASGRYEIVAEQSALEPNEAQTVMETILQKNPDCRVVTGIGAGPMIGANEALVIQTGGEIPEDMGVFTTDVTKQQLEQLMDEGAASKGIIGFEGSDVETGEKCAAMFAMIFNDQLEVQNVFREMAPITAENAEQIMAEMK